MKWNHEILWFAYLWGIASDFSFCSKCGMSSHSRRLSLFAPTGFLPFYKLQQSFEDLLSATDLLEPSITNCPLEQAAVGTKDPRKERRRQPSKVLLSRDCWWCSLALLDAEEVSQMLLITKAGLVVSDCCSRNAAVEMSLRSRQDNVILDTWYQDRTSHTNCPGGQYVFRQHVSRPSILINTLNCKMQCWSWKIDLTCFWLAALEIR